MVTAGSYTGKCLDASKPEVKARGNIPYSPAEYRKFFIEDDLLKGFIIIGDVNRSGIYTSIIRDKIPLSSIDFDAIKDEPRLMAFSKSRREQMLAAKDEVPETSWNFATM
jgi:NAD(P)H-nitrite reductase large subunit